MKVWLDDERHEPATWVRARTAAEAIVLLQSGGVQEISLDHDLGDDAAGTGYDVLLWIERAVIERGFVPPAIRVHTANPPARIRMLAAVGAIRKEASIDAYRREEVTLAMAARLAGVPLVDFMQLVSTRGIPVISGDAETLHEDLTNVDEWKERQPLQPGTATPRKDSQIEGEQS